MISQTSFQNEIGTEIKKIFYQQQHSLQIQKKFFRPIIVFARFEKEEHDQGLYFCFFNTKPFKVLRMKNLFGAQQRFI